MGHYPEFCAYYSLFSLEIDCMYIALQNFELDINGIILYIAFCFIPQSALCLGNSYLLVPVAKVHLFSLLGGISLYKLIVIHLCIILSMVI